MSKTHKEFNNNSIMLDYDEAYAKISALELEIRDLIINVTDLSYGDKKKVKESCQNLSLLNDFLANASKDAPMSNILREGIKVCYGTFLRESYRYSTLDHLKSYYSEIDLPTLIEDLEKTRDKIENETRKLSKLLCI